MLDWGELTLFRDTLQKRRLNTALIAEKDGIALWEDSAPEAYLAPPCPLPSETKDLTLYRARNGMGFSYLYFLLTAAVGRILLIGPYLERHLDERALPEIGEKNGIPPKQQRYFAEHCRNLPILAEEDPFFLVIDAFCERMWEHRAFGLAEGANASKEGSSAAFSSMSGDDLKTISVDLKTLERRYSFENELMRAVTLGQLHKEKQLLATLGTQAFEKRTSDSLRDIKNYTIIMNTLLRKAAEQGGVHPLHLDRLSSVFAAKLESMTDVRESAALMREMFKEYCLLVRDHATGQYSPVVQRAVNLIEADLSLDLSLAALATCTGVSGGYLSTAFKKETGRTLTAFVREKRVAYAMHLLKTTSLQIQTVALHCGIVDVQYFSKLFKRQTGKTPKEYRESL